MDKIKFTDARIAYSIRGEDTYIVWDQDSDVFGSGATFPKALYDLAENYDDKGDWRPEE